MTRKLIPQEGADGTKQHPTTWIRAVLTPHAIQRLDERFGATNLQNIKNVFKQALTRGTISGDGGEALVEHGCLLIAGEFENETFTVKTVYNLSEGCSNSLTNQFWHGEPTPWNGCKVVTILEEAKTDPGISDAVTDEAYLQKKAAPSSG